MENKITPKQALIRLHNQATRYFNPNDEKDQIVNKRFGEYKSIIEQAFSELEETKQINEIFKNAITIKCRGIHVEEKLDHSIDNFIYSIQPICEVIQNNIEEELKRQLREWVLKNAFPKELKVLEIIKKKGLNINDIAWLKRNDYKGYKWNLEQLYKGYNDEHLNQILKTKEEYDLLKEWLK